MGNFWSKDLQKDQASVTNVNSTNEETSTENVDDSTSATENVNEETATENVNEETIIEDCKIEEIVRDVPEEDRNNDTEIKKNMDITVEESENTEEIEKIMKEKGEKRKFEELEDLSKKKSKNHRTNIEPAYPEMAKMVLQSFKVLKMNNGIPVKTLRRHIMSKYPIDIKILHPQLRLFLEVAIAKGYLEENGPSVYRLKNENALEEYVRKPFEESEAEEN